MRVITLLYTGTHKTCLIGTRSFMIDVSVPKVVTGAITKEL